MTNIFPTAASVDITLLLEGTYPFTLGGVSSWVYQLMCNLPQYRFAIIFLGGRLEDYGDMRYPLPENLVHLEAHYLFDKNASYEPKEIIASQEKFTKMRCLHEEFNSTGSAFETLVDELQQQLFSNETPNYQEFLFSQQSWDYVTDSYKQHCSNISFIDYFWNVRGMHVPIWQIINIARHAPESKIFHSISTGYAGFLGALLQQQRKRPFIVSEHGIYTKERRIDLLKNEWVALSEAVDQKQKRTDQYNTTLWIDFFEILARICYSRASPIISLFEGYRKRQILDGAAASRARIIPNGVLVYDSLQSTKESPEKQAPIICLIGRVVPIKDIKTFIRAIAIVKQSIVNVRAWIVGPLEEDPEYVEECKNLVVMFDMEEQIIFTGPQKVQQILTEIDLIVLSSISEGLPLVLLEAFAAGIPAVATDVGACSELIYGKDPEDRALGKSGLIVQVANPKALADAIVTLIENPVQWYQARIVGLQRVKKFYNQNIVIQEYADIYQKAINSWQESVSN